MLTAAEIRYRRWRRDEYLIQKEETEELQIWLMPVIFPSLMTVSAFRVRLMN